MREIVKLRGYVPATRTIAVFEHIIFDPSPITYRDGIFEQLDAGSAEESCRSLVRSALKGR